MALDDPMVAELPAEVPLPRAPLVRVLAQLRFPLITSIESPTFIGPFQETIRGVYPVLRQEQIHAVTLGAEGVRQAQARTAWRFHDSSGDWRVSLTSEFVAIETTAYESRADFMNRLRTVVAALEQHIRPGRADRLGVRYIDRVRGSELENIARLVRQEVCGIATTAAAAHMQHTLTESRFTVENAELVARWGRLPAKVSTDPNTIPPIDEPSWILDLDMFSTRSMAVGVDAVLQEAERFAKRIYTFFRWAVTPEFLRIYGGNP